MLYLQKIWTAFPGMQVFCYVKSDSPSCPWGWLYFPTLRLCLLSARLQLGKRQSYYHLTVFTKSVLLHTVPPIQWLPLGSAFADKNCQGVWLTTHLHLLVRLGMSGAVPPILLFAFIAYIGTSLPGWVLSPEALWFCLVREFSKVYEALRTGTAIPKVSQWCMWATQPAESRPNSSILFLSSRLYIYRQCF
jgi:hypothetical protein